MKKELRFSAKIDTQEFDRALSKMQQQLKEIQKFPDLTRLQYENTQKLRHMGIEPGRTAVDRPQLDAAEAKSRRETEDFLKRKVRHNEVYASLLDKHTEKYKQHKTISEDIKKSEAERLSATQKAQHHFERMNELSSKIKAGIVGISQALKNVSAGDALGILTGGASGTAAQGGIGGILEALRKTPQGARLLRGGVFATAGYAVGSAVGKAGELYGEYKALPATITERAGSAQAVYNRQLKQILKEGALETTFFAEEKKKAMKEAESFVEGAKGQEFGNIVKAMITDAVAGAVMGGAIGGVPGALVSGIGFAAATGGTQLLGLAGIGDYGKAREERFNDLKSAKYEELIAKQKELNPLKKAAFEDFEENFQQDLSLQRALGLSDKETSEMYKKAKGFTRQDVRRMREGMLAAGSSTGAARGDTANLGLRLERDYGLTNASQILGRLGGVNASSTANEKMIAGILAASVKEGLDKSEFRAENRKFTETVAEKIYSLGAADPIANALIAAREASGITDKTTRGLEAARSASQVMSELEKQTGGVGSVLEMGAFLKSDRFKKLAQKDPSALAAIEHMSMDEVAAMSPQQKFYLEEATGEKFEDLYEEIRRYKDLKKTGPVSGLTELVTGLRKGPSANMADYKKFQAEKGKAVLRTMPAYNVNEKTAASMVEKMLKEPGLTFDEAKKRAEGEIPPSPQDGKSLGDKQLELIAESEKAMLIMRDHFNPNLDGAAKAAEKFTETLNDSIKNILAMIAGGASPEDIRNKVKEISMGPSGQQPQATPKTNPPTGKTGKMEFRID